MPLRTTPIFVFFIYSNIAVTQWITLSAGRKDSAHDFSGSAILEQNERKYSERLDNSNGTEDYVFVQEVPLISGPLIESISQNSSLFLSQNQKRNVPIKGFSYDTKMNVLQLHNLYRSNVTPSAGNMAFMEWEPELERLAQMWADRCDFEHGMPDNDYPETIGQNLYIGPDPSGYNAVWLWYEEYKYYDVKKQYCLPEKQCGHFIQLAWAPSNRLGCGIKKCGMRYFIVCHYSRQALRGIQMYLMANPCSQCPDKDGALCLKNLCLNWEQCTRLPFLCEFAKCNLECHNCGKLDKKRCLCECAEGWDYPDCSNVCMDQHKRCGKSPGWPSIAACSLNNHAVAETFCRKMCGKCKSVNEESMPVKSCCSGKLCEDGLVPSSDDDCECVLPCIGPNCDVEKKVATNTHVTTTEVTQAVTTEPDISEEKYYEEKAEPSTNSGKNLDLNRIIFLLGQISVALWFSIK